MRVLVPLRWADMDAFGHVNNVQYLRLLEIARIESLGQILGEAVLGGIVVARHEIEYLAPMDFRLAPVAVDLWVTRVGRTGFDVGYHVQDPPEVGERRYAVAATTMVLFDPVGGRPRALTAGEVAGLQPHLGEPVAFRGRPAQGSRVDVPATRTAMPSRSSSRP